MVSKIVQTIQNLGKIVSISNDKNKMAAIFGQFLNDRSSRFLNPFEIQIIWIQ